MPASNAVLTTLGALGSRKTIPIAMKTDRFTHACMPSTLTGPSVERRATPERCTNQAMLLPSAHDGRPYSNPTAVDPMLAHALPAALYLGAPT